MSVANAQALAFDAAAIDRLGPELALAICRAYEAATPLPKAAGPAPDIPAIGAGLCVLPDLWAMIVDRSAHLASPWMSGHMDTAPHPAAALTQALVAALNNNLLFRELSPFASEIEEQLIAFFTEALSLGPDWHGLFASGGSVANLTALFAACGGYVGIAGREHVHLLIPASGHLSLSKSAAVLGIPGERMRKVTCDEAGRLDLNVLEESLQALPKGARAIVVSVLGTTIHGSVDDVAAASALCRRFGAWHHVDAIYGAALALSLEHRHFTAGLQDADSIVLGPQKWMYVPRVSALCLIRGEARFERSLGTAIPYSLGDAPHRGRWGLQGSRPADAIVLWATLQTIGTMALGQTVDRSIALTKRFNRMLERSRHLEPTHCPDLNLQTFRIGGPDRSGERIGAIQARLAAKGRTWMSASRWRDETLMRAVLLAPSLMEAHLEAFIADIEAAL